MTLGAQGTAVIDFGAFPGSGSTSVVVTGQASILATSAVEAWMRPQDATADHSVDEHIVENIKIVAGAITAASGFTIYAECMLGGTLYGVYNVNWVWN